ncbi:MAG: cupin domain-containing protein [bacterium]|nr:cupin domain-containing protein [bacterium]
MKGHVVDITSQALANSYFRQVLETGQHTQVVIMSIPIGGEIGEEVHVDHDQVLYLVEGEGEVVLNDEKAPYKKGDLVLVNAGTRHNFVNTGSADLKIITTYSPPHHPAGTVHKTKEEAEKANY